MWGPSLDSEFREGPCRIIVRIKVNEKVKGHLHSDRQGLEKNIS